MKAIAVLGLEEVDLTSSMIQGIVAALDGDPEPEAPAADEVHLSLTRAPLYAQP